MLDKSSRYAALRLRHQFFGTLDQLDKSSRYAALRLAGELMVPVGVLDKSSRYAAFPLRCLQANRLATLPGWLCVHFLNKLTSQSMVDGQTINNLTSRCQ